MRRSASELWEIGKVWWLLVVSGALGVVAIVQAIKGAHGKSVWFWGFWAMTALAVALGLRLRRVVGERDKARARLGDQDTADSRAHRLDELADEAILIRDDEVPPGNGWGNQLRRSTQVFEHWQLRADAEVRRSATEHMDIWRENPENPMLLRFGTPDQAREFIDFNVAQLRQIASELRK